MSRSEESLPKTFTLSGVTHNGRKFLFTPSQVFSYYYDGTSRSTCIESKDLNVSVLASSSVETQRRIGQEIAVLWDNYALEDPGKLSTDTKKLRLRILAVVTEVAA